MARIGTLALVLASGTIIGLAPCVQAQSIKIEDKQVVGASAKPAGPTKIDRYAKVLTLDKPQTDAAKSLYEAYQTETNAQGKKMRDAMKDAQDDMNEGDHAAFEKKMQKAMGEQTAASKKLTETFLSDLKSLLNPVQADRWPSFERLRRREQYLSNMLSIGGMGVGGSSVDLFPLIDKLGLPTELRAKAVEHLSLYEVDIDRPLAERQRNMDEEQQQMGAVQKFDAESFAKKQERDRKVDMTIREVNTKYVRQIGAALPADWAAKLDEAYQARAYRSIYRETSTGRTLANAQKVADLSSAQKTALQAMIDKYKKDVKGANDRWADAQRRAEDAGRNTGGGLMMFGPGSSGGEKIDPAIADARDARKALDAAAKEQMEKLLSQEQLAAIPQAQPSQNGVRSIAVFGDHAGGDAVFVDDIDMGDDGPGAGGPGAGPNVIFRTISVGGHGPGDGSGGGQVTTPTPTTAPSPPRP